MTYMDQILFASNSMKEILLYPEHRYDYWSYMIDDEELWALLDNDDEIKRITL